MYQTERITPLIRTVESIKTVRIIIFTYLSNIFSWSDDKALVFILAIVVGVVVTPAGFLLRSFVKKLSSVFVLDWYLGRLTEDSVCVCVCVCGNG